jgi:DNA-binding transcriptional LysR family regulator
MQDLNDLFYFAQVAQHGGFAAASRALGVPKSKLSRRVALLEARLGVRLIQRSTRRFSVTELGQDYLLHCKAMLVEADAAQEAIERTRSQPRGTVRMTCPIALLDTRVGAILADFMLQYPQVEVHLEATDRRVDVISEAIDLALRVRTPPLQDSELVLRSLAPSSQCLVGAPQLLRRLGTPTVPSDLPALPSMDLGTPQSEHVWSLLGPDGAQALVHHHPRLITRGMIALRLAAMAGVGIVQLPTQMVNEEFERGALLRVLPDWAPRVEIIHAVFASRRGLLPSVRALIDFLAARFEGPS